MSTIKTVAELDAMPAGAQVFDGDGDAWRKLPNGQWLLRDRYGILADFLLADMGPLTTDAAPHDSADCAPCDDHADALVQADRDEQAIGGAL